MICVGGLSVFWYDFKTYSSYEKKTIGQIGEPSQFFEKISKIDKLLARFLKRDRSNKQNEKDKI